MIVDCLYLPNGNPQPGPKFDYKLAWMERLGACAELYALGLPVVLAGDFNVVPTDATSIPTRSYAKNALLQPRAARAVPALLDQGWIDAIRSAASRRADLHVLGLFAGPLAARRRAAHRPSAAEPDAAKRLTEAGVDREVRGQEGASDHAPAWIMLRDAPAARPRIRKRATRKPSRSRNAKKRAAPVKAHDPSAAAGDRRGFFAHRSYHALPKTILRRGAKPAGAILGFANFLLRLYREEQPRAVVVAWDTLEVPTYRHKKFPAYQSGRNSTRLCWNSSTCCRILSRPAAL